MSIISNCTFVSKKENFTKENLDKMRSLFNGKTITFENEKINIGKILKNKYGDADSDFGRRMFDIIVGRGTQGKPAVDSYTGFTEADFRRIKNELVRESKNLNNPKLNYLEKLLFVRRGVMQKFAVTSYLNNKINEAANYERTQFSNYLKSHNDIMALLKTDSIKNRGKSKFRFGIKSVRDLEKLENELTIIINNPQNEQQSQKALDITRQMSQIFKSEGGVPLQELRMFLEGDLIRQGNKYFKVENGDTIEVSKEIVKAGVLSRNLLNDMGSVMINGLKQHKQVVRQSYLNSKEDSALLLPNGEKVKRYEETIDGEIKAIEKGVKEGKYFPHYLIESFLKIEKVMDRAENDNYSNADKDLNDLSQVFLQMSKEIGTPRTAKGRQSIPYDNYLKNPVGVLRKYSLDAIAFNKSNYLKNIMMEGMRSLPKDSDGAEALQKYVIDTYTIADKGYQDRPAWVNKTVRTLTGVQFLSKMGFGIGTAVRNTLSGMYYLQGVGNRAFVKYLREWDTSSTNKIFDVDGKQKSLQDIIVEVEREQGFKFEDMSSPLFTEGLVPTEGIKSRDIDIKLDGDGNPKLQYKEGKHWRAFDSAMTATAGKGAIFQKVTENFLRKHMFRYSFVSKFNELTDGGLTKQQSIQRSKKHALDMVNKYAFEYSPSQKAPIIGGTKSGLGAVGQVAFQFMHYPMSFLQLQSEILRKSKDAAIARQWDSPDLYVPLRFAGLYLFTEMMSGVLNLDLQRLMENDTVERIKLLKEGLEGEDVKGRGFLGPTTGELFYYATLFDFVKTPDNLAAKMIVGYNDAYGMTDEQKRSRLLSSLNVQASKLLTKDYKALRNGNGWDLMMHEFGLYPTARTREMRKKEPLKTILPPVKKKKSNKKQSTVEQKRKSDLELSKLYRAMGV
tara:strand:- start:9355 stop:12051 length:2697 start_codon:yes stop_codon:yes gene_type:complete